MVCGGWGRESRSETCREMDEVRRGARWCARSKRMKYSQATYSDGRCDAPLRRLCRSRQRLSAILAHKHNAVHPSYRGTFALCACAFATLG